MEEGKKLTYTVPEAAELLGVATNSLYDAIRNGEFQDIIIRVGKRVLVSRCALARRLTTGEPVKCN
jgi:excisionase family DNA binding protein